MGINFLKNTIFGWEEIIKHDNIIRNLKLTTPRAASIAGIVFSVMLITSLAFIRIFIPANLQDAGD